MHQKRIDSLRVGDLIDLQGDRFADPSESNPDTGWMEFELAKVLEIDRETESCIAVYFDSITVGFPPDHVVSVQP